MITPGGFKIRRYTLKDPDRSRVLFEERQIADYGAIWPILHRYAPNKAFGPYPQMGSPPSALVAVVAWLPDGRELEIAEYLSTRVDGQEVWHQRPEGARPIRYRVYPDYGCCVWTEHGAGTSIRFDFPGCHEINRLEQQLEDEWLRRWEAAEGHGWGRGSAFDWVAFNRLGEAFCLEVKSLLRDDVEIFYKRASEETPGRQPDFRIACID